MIQVTIPKSILVDMLADGYTTRSDQYERLIRPGETVTIVISDGDWTVPDTLPGGAILVHSRQVQYPDGAIALAEILTRI